MAGRKDGYMTVRIIGAVLVVIGCGVFGMLIASSHKIQSNTLRQFIMTLDLMECELQYRQMPLPELCRVASQSCRGILKTVFLSLAIELEKQISPNVERCMTVVLENTADIPKLTRQSLQQLGQSLGRFDLDGQLKGINSVRIESQRMLDAHASNQDLRIRCYQTLSICAGAAMAILLI